MNSGPSHIGRSTLGIAVLVTTEVTPFLVLNYVILQRTSDIKESSLAIASILLLYILYNLPQVCIYYRSFKTPPLKNPIESTLQPELPKIGRFGVELSVLLIITS